MEWNRFDCLLAGIYLAGLLAIGILAGRRRGDSNQFLNASASLPLWICVVACIAANCGSLDVIAMMALGAQYGILACHFYWIGAVPALIVVAFWLLPAYARHRFPTVLDFIRHYYGDRTRSIVALCLAAMMLLLAGVCLCAAAQTMTAFLGWSFGFGVLLTAAVVLFYTWMGGLRATIYSELLHFAFVLATILPLFYLVVRDFHGVAPLIASIPAPRLHAWRDLPWFAPAATMDRVGLLFGLGLVLSFGYWSTDFVQMQRALAVRRRADMPLVPLSMAAARIIFAFIIVLPGIAAPLILRGLPQGNWNATLPSLMLHYFRPSFLAIGFMGIVASLISTFANNVSGFTAAYVQGIYQGWIHPAAPDAHYLHTGRITAIVAVLLSVGGAYLALTSQSLMEYIQMVLAAFNAPLFALVALAALAPARAATGGSAGMLTGIGSSGVHQVLLRAGLLHYGSRMSADFYAAILSFCVTVVAVLAFGHARVAQPAALPAGPREGRFRVSFTPATLILALLVAAICVFLNIWLR